MTARTAPPRRLYETAAEYDARRMAHNEAAYRREKHLRLFVRLIGALSVVVFVCLLFLGSPPSPAPLVSYLADHYSLFTEAGLVSLALLCASSSVLFTRAPSPSSTLVGVALGAVTCLLVGAFTLGAASDASDLVEARIEAKYGVSVDRDPTGTESNVIPDDGEQVWSIDGVERRCDVGSLQDDSVDPVLKCLDTDADYVEITGAR